MKKVKRMFAGALTGQGLPPPSRTAPPPMSNSVMQPPAGKLAQLGQALQGNNAMQPPAAKLAQIGQAMQGVKGPIPSQGLASIANAPAPNAPMGRSGGLGRMGATPPVGVNPLAGKTMPNQGRMAKGGKVSSASKRADGIAQRGKTRGKMV